MTFAINQARIMANHAKAIAQARAVENLANSLTSEINRLNITEQNLRSVWEGQTSNVFRSRISMLRSELNIQRGQLFDLAASIRRIADATRHADEAAARRAFSTT